MWRYLAGAAGGVAMLCGGLMLGRSGPVSQAAIPSAPPAAPGAADVEPSDDAAPPQASPKTREQKRFGRYDKDKDGAVTRDEYLLARRKAFAKLDRNGDGRLDFEEYAVKTAAKFTGADADRSGRLTATEFATTRVIRKARAACPPAAARRDEDEG